MGRYILRKTKTSEVPARLPAIAVLAILSACGTGEQAQQASGAAASGDDGQLLHPEIWPRADNPIQPDSRIEQQVASILAAMSLEEKVGQVIQADIASVSPDDVAEYHLGAVLNGGNSAPDNDLKAGPDRWLALADEFWLASTNASANAIPVLWGTDAVHGHSNVVGATIFPHNIGLGAANDPELIRRIGEVTAMEIAVTGLDWTFAPTLATPRDDRWGRTYEGYSEAPDIVAAYAAAMVRGLQGDPGTDAFLSANRVIATGKHFLGDGGTRDGIDQGDTVATEEQLRDIHAAGYVPAIESGVQTVMASYSSWHNRKMHGNRVFLTDLLVDQMGFDGFVIGDWNGHAQVEGCSPTDCPAAFDAGLDMYMAPDSWKGLYENLLSQAGSGQLSMARLDQAVSRILRVKLRAGLFDKGLPSTRPLAGRFELLGSDEHRAVAREAVRKSLVLLKNDGVLPLSPGERYLVAGPAADSMEMQTGGWTLSWQGTGNAREDFPRAQTIYEGIAETVSMSGGLAEYSRDGSWSEKPDVAIVVFGERPYAEFRGDLPNLDYADDEGLTIMNRLSEEGIPVVAVFVSGRPLWTNPEINAANAFVAAWLPGSEGAGIADVLFTDDQGDIRFDFAGRLSFSWPATPGDSRLNVGAEAYDPLFAYGYGLTHEDDGSLPALRTDYETGGVRNDIVFNEGAAQGPWTLVLRSSSREVDIALRSSVPDDALSVSWTDRAAQEDSITLQWRGEGVFEARGPAVDWTREANAQMAMRIDYRVEQASNDPVVLGISCGQDCNVEFPLDVSVAEVSEWKTWSMRLQCFEALRLDLRNVASPFYLRSAGGNSLSVSFVGLETTSGADSCEF